MSRLTAGEQSGMIVGMPSLRKSTCFTVHETITLPCIQGREMVTLRMSKLSENLLCRNAFSDTMIAPPCASPAPPWGGGAYDAPVLPVRIISRGFCTGNTELSQLGRHSGGAKPLRASESFEDFNRARKLIIRDNFSLSLFFTETEGQSSSRGPWRCGQWQGPGWQVPWNQRW